jgi:succinoglycan biosynthesis transport protein ExoP
VTEAPNISDPPGDQRAQLREYLAVLRLRKWSILAVTVLVVAGAMFFSIRQVPIYESQARVLVKALSQGALGTSPSVNMQTERELVTSIQVADLVAEDLDAAERPEQLLRGLRVDVAPQTEILVMAFQHQDPLTAKRRAQSFAESYLQFRRNQAEEEVLAAGESLQKRKEDLEQERANKEEKLADLPVDDPQRIGLQTQVNQFTSEIAVLDQQLSQVIPAEKLLVGQIVEPALLPSEPVSPDHLRNAILALVVGLLLGVGVAFLRERLDDRLRGRLDLEAHVGAPVLAVVPKVGTWRKRAETPLVSLAEPRSTSSEAYRTLRTSLLFAASQQGLKTILVTSPQAGDGKTATSANLAVVLAQAHKRVILLSADLRKPRLHKFFEVPNDVGLTSVLIGEAKPWEAVKDVGLDYLKVVTSGPIPGNPAELLGSDAMGRLLEQFREVADFVVIDSAPALVVSDALAVAPFVDTALFVADAERTTRGAVTHGRSQLEQVSVNFIGAVLNNFDPSKGRISPYYYSYYYQYRYSEEPTGRGARLRRQGKKPQPVAEGSQEEMGFERPSPEPTAVPEPDGVTSSYRTHPSAVVENIDRDEMAEQVWSQTSRDRGWAAHTQDAKPPTKRRARRQR